MAMAERWVRSGAFVHERPEIPVRGSVLGARTRCSCCSCASCGCDGCVSMRWICCRRCGCVYAWCARVAWLLRGLCDSCLCLSGMLECQHQCLHQRLDKKWLRNVVIHADGQAAVGVALHGVGSQRADEGLRDVAHGTNQSGRTQTVHDGHLKTHNEQHNTHTNAQQRASGVSKAAQQHSTASRRLEIALTCRSMRTNS